MRRSFVLSLCAVALLGALLSATPVQGQTATPTTEARDETMQRRQDERRGLNYDGLRQRPGGPCGDAYEIVEQFVDGLTRCTHGPDPAPDGVDVRVYPDFEGGGGAGAGAVPQPGVAAAQAGIPCYGTGTDGFRVQLLYVRANGAADKSATYLPSFVNWAANANTAFKDSAAKTGGVRNIRFVTDSSCNLSIPAVQVSFIGINSLSGLISELKAKGYNRSDRKYLAWVDTTAANYCGIAEIYIDDKPTTTPGVTTSNYSNGHPGVKGTFGRVDAPCWGKADSVEAHELTHMLGGVQPSAPHATPKYHCRDESDRLCYVDESGLPMSQVCALSNERLLDCNNDDYFSSNPPAGSYLATHWNVANNAFLAKTAPGSSPPPPPPPPPTTTTTTTTVPAGTTTTTKPPATTTTTAAPASTPSAPRSLAAYRFGSGILLYWSPPTTGPVTGYNVYRRTATGTFTKIADIGTGTNYTDGSGTVGVAYTYAVSAENGSREGPRSNQVTATR